MWAKYDPGREQSESSTIVCSEYFGFHTGIHVLYNIEICQLQILILTIEIASLKS